MRTTMTVAIAVGLAAFFAAGAARAENLDTPVPEEKLTLNLIQNFLDQAAYKTEIDSDGDLKVVNDGGMKAFVRADAERKIITIFAAYPLKASAPELTKLQLVNRLNDRVIVVRFCMPDATTLWCDYQFSYEGGLTPRYILHVYRQFIRIVRIAVAQYDTDDVVGSD